jgi:hypothetical protein
VAVYCNPVNESCPVESTAACRPVCSADDESKCGAYRCDLATLVCEDHCLNDPDCAAGYVCDEKDRCVPAAATISCVDDSACGTYACSADKRCFTHCRSTADCSDGAVCNAFSECGLPCSAEFDPVCSGHMCQTSGAQSTCQSTCFDNQSYCAPGYRCENDHCVLTPECSAESSGACGKYRCDTNLGRCLAQCQSDDDCVSSSYCFLGECN